MSDTILFTPYVSTDQSVPRIRAYLQISKEDRAKHDALPRQPNQTPVEVFDHVTQTTYFVRPADCGGACFCAAEIVSVGKVGKEY